MSDLHSQIMNIRTTSKGIGNAVEAGMKWDNDWEDRLALAYKIGHRDSRHAAAELSLKQHTIDQSARITEIAKLFGICDGGQYINDWETIAKKYHDQSAEIEKLKAVLDAMRQRCLDHEKLIKEQERLIEKLKEKQ